MGDILWFIGWILGRVYKEIARRIGQIISPIHKSCLSAKNFITSQYYKYKIRLYNKNKLITKIKKMRTKEVILTKLERLEAEVKLIGYNMRTANQDIAYEKVGKVLEDIGDIRTILNTEHQD
jgi:hypothetical protein